VDDASEPHPVKAASESNPRTATAVRNRHPPRPQTAYIEKTSEIEAAPLTST